MRTFYPIFLTRVSDSRHAVGVPTFTDLAPTVPDLDRMTLQRLARLRAEMDSRGVDALVLLHGPHVSYATGWVPESVDATHAVNRRAVAIVTPEEAYLHPPPGHTGGAAGVGTSTDSAARAGVTLAEPLWPELDDGMAAFARALGEALGDVRGRRVAIDEITGAMARSALLSDAELSDARAVLAPARLIKTDDEIACTDAAQRLNEVAMEAARAAAVPGATRSEVTGVFLRRIHEMGCTICMIDPIFEVVPKTREDGPRTSTGHIAFPTGVHDPVLAEGDLMWVDTGIGYEGYVSDFGRTWVVGRDPVPEEVEMYDRWMAVTDAAYEAIRPGATLGDVGRAATVADAAAGGDRPWLPHFYLAHGIGVESAEMPMIGTDLGQDFDDSFVLAPNMLLVLEPIAWRDGFGGYRAEEIVAVTDDGCRLLGSAHHYLPFSTPPGRRWADHRGTANHWVGGDLVTARAANAAGATRQGPE